MNKTIIININGTVFHIEEDAYEILKSYMMEVKRHFMDSADSLEITTSHNIAYKINPLPPNMLPKAKANLIQTTSISK